MLDDVDGHGEDDGGVVLGGDGGEGLQVPEVALVNIVLMVLVLRWHVDMVEITSITILMSMSWLPSSQTNTILNFEGLNQSQK